MAPVVVRGPLATVHAGHVAVPEASTTQRPRSNNVTPLQLIGIGLVKLLAAAERLVAFWSPRPEHRRRPEMAAVRWEAFASELHEALVQVCPSTTWHVELYATEPARMFDEITGLAVQAKQGGITKQIEIPATAVQPHDLRDLVDHICRQAAA